MPNYRNQYDKYRQFTAKGFPVRHKAKILNNIDLKLSIEYRDKISEMREMDRSLGNMILSFDDYANLVSEAHASNVHWSTKIEGNTLSLDDVRRSSRLITESKELIVANDPGPTQEIINHLYSYYIKEELSLPWSVETISAIHSILMNNTGEECIPGRIREKEEMSVVLTDGTESFIACPAIHVKNELESLLYWINNTPLESVIAAVIFFHEFESIHPFTEGNGRTGRSLFHVIVQEFGYCNFNLCKLDVLLLEDSALYYSLMEYTDDSGDYTPIIEYFIDCMYWAYSEALESFKKKDLLKGMDENTKTIALHARDINDWFSITDASEWISGLSDQTIRSKLSELVEKDILEKEGKTRNTRFRFRDPFRYVKETAKQMTSDDSITD